MDDEQKEPSILPSLEIKEWRSSQNWIDLLSKQSEVYRTLTLSKKTWKNSKKNYFLPERKNLFEKLSQ